VFKDYTEMQDLRKNWMKLLLKIFVIFGRRIRQFHWCDVLGGGQSIFVSWSTTSLLIFLFKIALSVH
jgi:hypothetical protein